MEALEIPEVAIREAVINAVVHADYAQTGAPIRIAVFEDRIEIDNLGRVFQQLRLIEQWGSGIQRMTAACIEAGLPAPVFEEIGISRRAIRDRLKHLVARGLVTFARGERTTANAECA